MHTLAKHPFSAWCALLFAFCAALLCSGCAPVSASVATLAPTPCASGEPAAAPAEPDYAVLSERADAAFHEAFSIDFSTFMLPQMQYITDLMAQHDTFLAMAQRHRCRCARSVCGSILCRQRGICNIARRANLRLPSQLAGVDEPISRAWRCACPGFG